jgi:hypothetical protein
MRGCLGIHAPLAYFCFFASLDKLVISHQSSSVQIVSQSIQYPSIEHQYLLSQFDYLQLCLALVVDAQLRHRLEHRVPLLALKLQLLPLAPLHHSNSRDQCRPRRPRLKLHLRHKVLAFLDKWPVPLRKWPVRICREADASSSY